MEITVKKLNELKRPEKNIRRHTDKQISEYVRSVKMFGQIKPIICDENGVILAGNGLFEALSSIGKEECDCYVMAGLDEKQKKKLMLADNKIYELGTTDIYVFDDFLKDLEGDVDIPGWDEDLLKLLTASVAEATEVVESYGQIDSETIEHINNAEVIPHIPMNKIPSTGVVGNSANTSNPSVPSDNEETSKPYVICPKCGEKIWL